jgi:prepilin-type N-terminal cleavage/methylation domain-containing protein
VKARNNKGFTLVEIIVGLAVSALVLTAVYQIYLAQQKSCAGRGRQNAAEPAGSIAYDGQ